MSSPLETQAVQIEARAGRELVELDWLTTTSSNRLHHADLTDQQAVVLFEHRALASPVKFTCGRTVHHAAIPGTLTRLGAVRCRGCCQRKGYPQGTGSPKNVPACRRLLGLEKP